MTIIETFTRGLVTFHVVDNVRVGGEPVIQYVESETGYAPYDAQPVTPTRWVTSSDRALPE